jgi:hypothetical protein
VSHAPSIRTNSPLNPDPIPLFTSSSACILICNLALACEVPTTLELLAQTVPARTPTYSCLVTSLPPSIPPNHLYDRISNSISYPHRYPFTPTPTTTQNDPPPNPPPHNSLPLAPPAHPRPHRSPRLRHPNRRCHPLHRLQNRAILRPLRESHLSVLHSAESIPAVPTRKSCWECNGRVRGVFECAGAGAGILVLETGGA